MIPEELAPSSTVRPPSTMNVIAGAQRSAVGKEFTSIAMTEEIMGTCGNDSSALITTGSANSSELAARAHVSARVGDGDARTEGDDSLWQRGAQLSTPASPGCEGITRPQGTPSTT